MSAAAKDVSASQDKAGLEVLAGPAMAAMVLPTTVMMSGFVAAWGLGMAFARAFSVSANEAVAGAARTKAPAPRLVVSNPEPVEAAKPAPAKPTGIPPKPSTPGGSPPKPKSAKAVSPKDVAPLPKAGAVKPPVDEMPVVAAPKPAPKAATPKVATPKAVTTETATAPAAKAKSPVASKAKASAPAAKTTKVVPSAAKPMTIKTTSTAKGISLPKLSIQDKPDGKTGKD
jgi:outer membrane biosynthesis protein TonB